jgi:hypothetical protein
VEDRSASRERHRESAPIAAEGVQSTIARDRWPFRWLVTNAKAAA